MTEIHLHSSHTFAFVLNYRKAKQSTEWLLRQVQVTYPNATSIANRNPEKNLQFVYKNRWKIIWKGNLQRASSSNDRKFRNFVDLNRIVSFELFRRISSKSQPTHSCNQKHRRYEISVCIKNSNYLLLYMMINLRSS